LHFDAELQLHSTLPNTLFASNDAAANYAAAIVTQHGLHGLARDLYKPVLQLL
jgi:hypothetical protein